MRGLLPLLFYAGIFYLMMRFGCGAHMVHGGHSGHGDGEHEGHSGHGTQEGPAKDPVCGMQLEPGQGYTKNHAGRELHFCSRKCLDKFEAEPQRYLA
ncbi:MAG TPA: YHS domain-containing protein [Candidatus Acidoferrales bacterium]|nr:YHS domain-containing protein [Candidatus Acidoferrales bacterium]